MSTVSSIRRKTSEVMSDTLACRYCGDPAPWATLSALGARCVPCYRSYCSGAVMGKPLPEGASVPDGVPPLHRWAWRLRARVDAGQRLAQAQIECLAEFEKRHGAARA